MHLQTALSLASYILITAPPTRPHNSPRALHQESSRGDAILPHAAFIRLGCLFKRSGKNPARVRGVAEKLAVTLDLDRHGHNPN